MAEELKEEIKEEVADEETEDTAENVADTTETVEEPVAEEHPAEAPEYPTVTIRLADGTEISNIKVNGDNLISETDIKEHLTSSNLVNVKFDGADLGTMKLAGYVEYPDGYHFVLLEKKQSELEIEKLSAKLEYVAIMTDVEVD